MIYLPFSHAGIVSMYSKVEKFYMSILDNRDATFQWILV